MANDTALPAAHARTVNIAAYRFARLEELSALKIRLARLCNAWRLKGTILLSTEGINLFVAGGAVETDALLTELRSWPALNALQVKTSNTDRQPFRRMLVRIKKEIIAFGIEGIDPSQHSSPKLAPRELKRWLDEGRPVMLLDTRNRYEVKLGTFKNAHSLDIDQFRNFPQAVRALPTDLKAQPIVMFCTGGIRCEKAGPFMQREGFENVYQLEGGILKYFEECGGSHYEGECFVFDQRVGVDPALAATGSAQCFNCQTPLSEAEQRDDRYRAGSSCPYCFMTPAQQMADTIAIRHERIRIACSPLPGSQPRDNFKPVHVPMACDGQSILQALCRVVKHLPVQYWQSECAREMILDADRRPVAADRQVRAGERYLHKFIDVIEPAINPHIRILHEDAALVVVDKPAPLPMHDGGRFYRNTLQYILSEAYRPEKPRAAHRLDSNTTGVLLVTRTRQHAARLQSQFARGEIEKVYLVRVLGSPAEDDFICDAPISAEQGKLGTRFVDRESGLPALTRFHVIERYSDGTSLLQARPLSGRTHQIRIHLWHRGFPVCGDPAYLPHGGLGITQTLSISDPPLCLHAWQIKFRHPLTGAAMEFAAPAPDWSKGARIAGHAASAAASVPAVSGS